MTGNNDAISCWLEISFRRWSSKIKTCCRAFHLSNRRWDLKTLNSPKALFIRRLKENLHLLNSKKHLHHRIYPSSHFLQDKGCKNQKNRPIIRSYLRTAPACSKFTVITWARAYRPVASKFTKLWARFWPPRTFRALVTSYRAIKLTRSCNWLVALLSDCPR